MQSDDYLRAHFAGLSYEEFIARRKLLHDQARQIMKDERREQIRRRLFRVLLPWVGLLARGRFSRKLSLILDRLISEAEKE